MNTFDQDPVVIVSAARTPLGSFQGVFSGVPATALGSVAIKAAVERAGLKPEQVDEVIMGCVLPAALGQAPARQATLGAGLPISVGATTVNKVCGSGMRAMMNAHDALAAGSAEIMVAGGMENMTNAPYMLPKARSGYRIGHSQIFDHMMMDGLEDAYDKGRAMGTFGEDCAEKYQFTREAQDAFAIESVKRAQQASTDGTFATEIAPVTVTTRAGDVVVDTDEGPGKIKTEKIPTLKPAFKKDGTITAASSSSINDGAAALVMMRASKAKALGLKPIAKMCGHATFAQAPNWFTTAPVTGIERLLKKNNWTVDSVDLWEINEAFAVVPMAAMHDLNIPHSKVNVHGGACALGHPIGASGARIVVTLLHALKKHGLKRGVATLCIGGGEATAIGVECLDD
jgi:acetyl-CoA C-acetyltransferase